MACRNREATKAAIARLKQETGLGDDAFEFIQLDLSSFRSIDAFVREIKVKGLPINLLIANAGIMMLPKYTETEDGVEMQFGVNHLGHFHLITSLLDVIKKSAPARIVIVSSTAHLMANKIDYNRIFDKSKYNSDANYCISKLANVMFSNALAKRLVGSHVTVNSLHPGVVSTSLVRHLPMQSVLNLIMRLVFLSSLDGASTSIYLALSSDIAHISGEYWARETTQEPNPNALREDEQEKLWRLSEKLIAEIEARLNQGHAK
ncbi:Retinol dehydrogenase 14 [Spiromyces aspiralis]|uniref:Retinol dehydrogenase 14 n=1 Tax=Spiromyces aspiralis TaxID=68401 RepID=A0ACC1HSW3_9FUNG|nr:Retinol dehydrogenase 14 [Spiromyces aspiralis]